MKFNSYILSEFQRESLKDHFIMKIMLAIVIILILTIGSLCIIRIDYIMKMQIDANDQLNYIRQEVEAPAEPEAVPADCGWATPPYDVPLQGDYVWWTIDECADWRVDPKLALAVMGVESDYDIEAISDTGDYGLMQINKSNFEWLQCELGQLDMMDPRDNITAGVYMLGSYLFSYDGNVNKALMAYNMGGKKAQNLWDKGIYETDYTKKVLAEYSRI